MWPALLQPPEHGDIRPSSGAKIGAKNSNKWMVPWRDGGKQIKQPRLILAEAKDKDR